MTLLPSFRAWFPAATFSAVLVLLPAAPAAMAQSTAPQRIVSFNICTDQLVVSLADPAQVAGLSPYATDPTLSVVADEARKFRRLPWHAESIIPLAPDLVLVGPRDRAITQRLLTALSLRVVEIPFISTIADAREQITHVAGLLGQPARGAALLAKLDAAQARLHAARERLADAARPAKTALMVERSGYAEGQASLAAGLIAEAGLVPPEGAPAGIGGFVALERLIVMRPDLLMFKSLIQAPRDQGSVYLTHPALKALYPPSRRIVLPGRYTLCGGPGLVAGLDHLADELARLAREQ